LRRNEGNSNPQRQRSRKAVQEGWLETVGKACLMMIKMEDEKDA